MNETRLCRQVKDYEDYSNDLPGEEEGHQIHKLFEKSGNGGSRRNTVRSQSIGASPGTVPGNRAKAIIREERRMIGDIVADSDVWNRCNIVILCIALQGGEGMP